ncbi:ankyrin repeat domain-containing protein [Chryseobacterium indoltheticum]|jgi:ankyrin repeat protein|uniref:ankyrin repeat domain-containing protein n=1 Tax=Chryseobacterium indoltheticum TaxID=254 RepID=UPI0024321FE3|nr:ankyrin repeat domain-containing protein [Chryseobacterium indoltheticum]
MKKIIFLIFFTMTLFSCQDTRSRKTQNKEQYPPQKLFEGKQLEAAQKIFDEDNSGLESVLKDDPQIINQLSDNKGYTLLMYASVVENLPAMEILLKNGADPNIVVPNEGLGLPLSHAVALNNYEMAKLLFKYKANPNPELGNSPLCNAMSLGNEQTEKKMIDFLLDNGADINHTSYLGHNIMEEAARNLSQFRIALYLLEKGGNPKIKGTELSPMAKYIEYEKKKTSENKNPKAVDYYENLLKVSTILQEKYHITFPVKDDPKAEAKLRIKLYEKLSEKDKKSVNFNKNYGENRYKEDQKLLLQ